MVSFILIRLRHHIQDYIEIRKQHQDDAASASNSSRREKTKADSQASAPEGGGK